MPAKPPRSTDATKTGRVPFRYRHGTRAHIESKRIRKGSARAHYIIHNAEFRKTVRDALDDIGQSRARVVRRKNGAIEEDGDPRIRSVIICKAAINILRNVTQSHLTRIVESAKLVLGVARAFVLTPRLLGTAIAIPEVQSGRYIAPDILSRAANQRAEIKVRRALASAAREAEHATKSKADVATKKKKKANAVVVAVAATPKSSRKQTRA